MWKNGFILLTAIAVVSTVRAANKSDASEPFFREPRVRAIQIEIPTASLPAFKEGQREYIRATVREGETSWQNVGVRLKGHGTFQPIDRKPGLALKFNEFISGQEFHGMTKLTLNNCATDPSFLREVLATGLFHEAGLPVARVTHARVTLNGRDLGFYVLAEGMNKNFLKREFGNANGNLYEGETKDIDQHLDQENGDDASQKDLLAILDAARQPAAVRMEKLRAVLDVDAFTSFVAMEVLLGSIDGYAYKKNNYRIYEPPKTGRAVFIPHGLDATFGSAGFEPPRDSLLMKALWDLPEFQRNFRARLAELDTKVWRVEVLTSRVTALAANLMAAAPDRAMARQIEEEARKLRVQIAKQQELLAAELKHFGK